MLFAAFFSSSALAAETHPYTGTSFGPTGTSGSSFNGIQSIAIDPATNDVYVYDGAAKIYKFNAAGEPIKFSALAGNAIENVGSASGAENQVAIAPPGSPGGTAGDIYVANNSVVLIYAPNGEKIGELTGGETCGVAVDPAGHVFVGVYRDEVREYVPAANPATNADLKNVSSGKVERVCNVAADGLGNVYAAAYEGAVIVKLAGLGAADGTRIEPGAPTIGVDPATNDLYADRGREVFQYDSTGKLIGSFGAGQLLSSRGVAVNGTSGKVYVGNGADGKVDVFGPIALLPDVEIKAASGVKRTAATLNGTIGAAGGPAASCEFQYTSEALFQTQGFKGASSVPCNPAGPFTGSSTQAVKADISGLSVGAGYRFRILATNENGSNPGLTLSFTTFGPVNLKTAAASGLSPSGATLNATINPEGIELDECLFEFGVGTELNQSQPCAETPAQIGSGETAVSVHANLTGLNPNSAYSFRIAASNSLGESRGEVKAFETTGPPTIANQAVAKVTTTGATIAGEVNPHGQATGFQLEYVSEADFNESGYAKATRVPPAPAEVGGGFGLVEVTQEITGLAEATAYRARLVASNASGTVQGPDTKFVTFPTPTGLPEGRAYEMVSPAQKIGDVFPPEPVEELGGSQSCPAYCQPGTVNALMPIQTNSTGEAISFVGQPFAEGQAPSSNQYISRRSPGGWANRNITPLRADKNSGFKALSSDFTRGVLLQDSLALSPEAPTGAGGKVFSNLYLWEEGNPDLEPLIKVKPPQRDPSSEKNYFGLFFGGANSGTGGVPAFTHLVFEANDALTAAVPNIAPAAPEAEAGECGDNHTELSSKSCDIYEWVGGQLRLVNVLPGNATAVQHAVIGSGRRLAVPNKEAQAPDTDHAISADGSRIFWSDESGQVYVRIDGEKTVKLKDPGQFITATPDGSKVMLSDGCLYSMTSESCEATLGSGDSSAFLGIAGNSEDLSRIYFVDKEALAPGAQAEACEQQGGEEYEGKVPPGNGCNLYVYDDGDVSHVATLVGFDNDRGLNGRYGDWKALPSMRTAQVSADGRYLTFVSMARLTGYDNRRADGRSCYGSIGPSCFEVYQYDLTSQSLSCASCNPSGLRPLGSSTLSLTKSGNISVFPQLRNLPSEGEGQVFFESVDALSAADHNGRIQDIYEWQANGVGGCNRPKGCISLISSGENSSDSFFLTSSPSGDDAFFITRAQLLLRDKDDLFDVYDARVGGGINENTPPPCLGEACKGPATGAPEGQSAGSAQFSGPGNEKPQKKKTHKHKKKAKKHKHKSKRAHKRAAKHNRGGQK